MSIVLCWATLPPSISMSDNAVWRWCCNKCILLQKCAQFVHGCQWDEIHCRKLTRVNCDVNFLLGSLLRERSTGESQDGSLGWWEVQSQAIALCSHHLISLSCVGQPTKIQWQLYEIPCSLKVVSSNKKADTRMGGKLANEKFSFCFYNLWILFNPLS